MTRKDDKGDQSSGGETTWTNTGGTRSGRGQHKTCYLGCGMLSHSSNLGTLRLPNDDSDDELPGDIRPMVNCPVPLAAILLGYYILCYY